MTTIVGWLIAANIVMAGVNAFIVIEGWNHGLKVDVNIGCFILHLVVVALAWWAVFLPH